MDTIAGPMGFNGFDRSGLLIEGFDKLPTVATSYNYPYYADLLTRHGFIKDVDLVEYRILNIGERPFPPRLAALAQKLKERRGYRVLEFRRKKDMLKWADELIDLLMSSHDELHIFTPLTKEQERYYTKKFFPNLNKDLVKGVVNRDNQLIGFFIAMPSMSRAFQKAKGRLFPFGIYHLWRAARNGNEVVDFCLAGVRKDLRGHGVDIVMAEAMYQTLTELGFREGETNPELEDNTRVRSEWKLFDHDLHKRRRLYTKPIAPA